MHARRRVPKSLPAQAHEGAAMTMDCADRVLVEGLQVEALVGVYAHERDAKQPLLFDIALPYDNRVPAASDAVEDAVDYAAVCTRVRAQVEALVAREAERGVPAGRVLLAGFSQGGAITLAAGARRREPLAGLIALSTYLPLGAATLQAMVPEARAQPIFMAHGLHDPVVPYTGGKRSRDALRDGGFDVEWNAYPMAHQVCGEEIAALSAWMSKRFASAA